MVKVWVPAFHVCAAPKVKPQLSVKLCPATDMSMPDVPNVSVLPELTFTVVLGVAMAIPAQLISAPSALVQFAAVVTVLSHLPMSALVGTVVVDQLVVRLRLSALLAFR